MFFLRAATNILIFRPCVDPDTCFNTDCLCFFLQAVDDSTWEKDQQLFSMFLDRKVQKTSCPTRHPAAQFPPLFRWLPTFLDPLLAPPKANRPLRKCHQLELASCTGE